MNDWIASLYRYPVTVSTCLLAVAATATWWLGGNVDAYMMGPEFWNGEVWRPFTTTLPHVNAIHLVFNLYWIFRFGMVLEGVHGSGKTFLIFVGLAAGSSLASHAVFEDGVGLSGVGYGLFGLLWVLRRRDTRFRGAFDDWTVKMFIVWFFLCIATTYGGIMNVGNFAHFFGAVFGMLLGRAIGNLARGKAVIGVAIAAAGLLVTAGAFARSSAWAMEQGLTTAVLHPIERGKVLAYEGYRAQERGEQEQAIEKYQGALALDQRDWRIWYDLGVALQIRERDDKASIAFQEAVSRAGEKRGENPYLCHAYKFLARRAAAKGDDKGAVTYWHKALDAGRDDAEVWHGLGMSLERLGDRAGAETAFRRAVASDRDNAEYRASLERVTGGK